MIRRYFTPSEASQLLPLIQQILGEMQQVLRTLRSLGPPEEEAAHVSLRRLQTAPALLGQLHALQRTLALGQERLIQLGVELQDLETGLVDFPTQLNGQEACLCWQQGEPVIGHWHLHSEKLGARARLDLVPPERFECWS